MCKHLFIFLLILNASFSQAQNVSKPIKADSTDRQWIISGYIRDEGKLWTSPIRYFSKPSNSEPGTRNLLVAVPVIVATGLAIRFDEKINAEVQRLDNRNKTVKNAGSIITNGGAGIFPVALSGAFYFGGLIFKDDRAMQTGFLCAYALTHTAVFITVGKFITGRQRPNADNGVDKWHWLPSANSQSLTDAFDSHHNSFPSGHSATAWTLATVIATQYNDKKFVAPVAYTLATAVSLSRLTEDKHWLSDAILGSVIGYGIGKYIANHHRNTQWTLLPIYSRNNVILTGIYRF